MQIVSYDKQYQEQVLKLWNQTMVHDYLSEENFYKKIILDENFDPRYCAIALEADEVTGFIWSVKRKVPYGDLGLEPNKGWIVGLCVAEEQQSKGVGTGLLNHVTTIMAEEHVTKIIVGAYAPHYVFPGVDTESYPNAAAFFEKNRFTQYGQAVSMERSLLRYHQTDAYKKLKHRVQQEGYQLTPFDFTDTEDLSAFLDESFPGDWALNVKQAVLSRRAEETVLVLRDATNEVVGYAQREIDGKPSRFGPFGVKPTLQGKGLGAYLFNEMLQDMVRRGLTHTYFLWTGGNAQRFYEMNGMQVYRSYSLMLKEL